MILTNFSVTPIHYLYCQTFTFCVKWAFNYVFCAELCFILFFTVISGCHLYRFRSTMWLFIVWNSFWAAQVIKCYIATTGKQTQITIVPKFLSTGVLKFRYDLNFKDVLKIIIRHDLLTASICLPIGCAGRLQNTLMLLGANETWIKLFILFYRSDCELMWHCCIINNGRVLCECHLTLMGATN